MNDDMYWMMVDQVINAIPYTEETADFRVYVAGHWRNEIAPSKHRDYGTECWERMGAKALICDISACYYRYKNLQAQMVSWKNYVMRNAIIDHFGYTVLYTVCKGFTQTCGIDALRILFSHMTLPADPGDLNEEMLEVGWDKTSYGFVEAIAMRQSFNMFKSSL